MEQIYLTRRNLLTLLSKLDNKSESACTIIKNDTLHPKYPCTSRCMVTAVEDDEYYADRQAGSVHEREELSLAKYRKD